MEEGGVIGRVEQQPLGSYRHRKTLGDGSVVRCEVHVYALEVELQMSTWPECHQRTAQWFALGEAAAIVRDPDLKAVILSLKTSKKSP
jgi:hypothetical protein